jgi:threonine aldolase
MQRPFIDFGSDTKTRPTAAMRQAMANADCGDEAAFEDPTVNALCERVAGLLGKESAVFMPSGSMCNQVALCVLGKRGDDIVCDETAHIVWYEVGGTAANAGLNALTLKGDRGRFTADQLRAAQRLPRMRHSPRQTVLSVEQTVNLGGGAIWPLTQIESVCVAARELGMQTHLDGARLLNAVVATGVSAARFAAPFDSAWIDFSKGLGAPVGAALAGSKDFIAECWRVKQRFGGAMRQAGIIAAGALYALDHHVERLADDHANAQRLARGLAEIGGIAIEPREVETNLVYFDLDPAGRHDGASFCKALLAHGVRMVALGPHRVRAVTHLDVSAADVEAAIAAVRDVQSASM